VISFPGFPGLAVDPVVIGRPPALGRGSPNEAARPSLRRLSIESLFEGRRIVDLDAAKGCLAGLWLWNDFLEESHAVSQTIDTPEGSWWHGIMHRREGDFGNAKYWFRRVGDHSLYPGVAEAAGRIAAASPDAGADRLASGSEWDPFRFVDLCEGIARRRSADDRVAREIAAEEWRLLFGHCAALAVGETDSAR
jgi:hypothetical protein